MSLSRSVKEDLLESSQDFFFSMSFLLLLNNWMLLCSVLGCLICSGSILADVFLQKSLIWEKQFNVHSPCRMLRIKHGWLFQKMLLLLRRMVLSISWKWQNEKWKLFWLSFIFKKVFLTVSIGGWLQFVHGFDQKKCSRLVTVGALNEFHKSFTALFYIILCSSFHLFYIFNFMEYLEKSSKLILSGIWEVKRILLL